MGLSLGSYTIDWILIRISFFFIGNGFRVDIRLGIKSINVTWHIDTRLIGRRCTLIGWSLPEILQPDPKTIREKEIVGRRGCNTRMRDHFSKQQWKEGKIYKTTATTPPPLFRLSWSLHQISFFNSKKKYLTRFFFSLASKKKKIFLNGERGKKKEAS